MYLYRKRTSPSQCTVPKRWGFTELQRVVLETQRAPLCCHCRVCALKFCPPSQTPISESERQNPNCKNLKIVCEFQSFGDTFHRNPQLVSKPVSKCAIVFWIRLQSLKNLFFAIQFKNDLCASKRIPPHPTEILTKVHEVLDLQICARTHKRSNDTKLHRSRIPETNIWRNNVPREFETRISREIPGLFKISE